MCSTLYEPHHHQQLMGFAASREAKRQKCQQQLLQSLELDGNSGALRVSQSRTMQQQQPQQEQQQVMSRLLGSQRLLEMLSSSSSSSLQQQRSSSVVNSSSSSTIVQQQQHEHLFYKVVTPSDVGKLNRLVIPKQHAERCFPLDPLLRKKGRLLSFQDSVSNEIWWFRYSYWSSSQSYVLTKGWIRFVKDKDLQAGDIISFERGSRQELYINCRKRPSSNNNSSYASGQQRDDELQRQPKRSMLKQQEQQLQLQPRLEQGAMISSSSDEDEDDSQTRRAAVATTTRLFGVDLRAKPSQDIINISL